MSTIMTLYNLATTFRQAIEKANDAGEFDNDITFYHFPRGCCSDTCYLLAEYLSENGIRSFYMEMNRGDCSHAWIAIDDRNIKEPQTITYEFPEEIQIVIMRVVCRNVIIYSRVREVDDLKDKIAGELVTESDKHYPDFRYE